MFLGYNYKNGYGFEENIKKACELYEKAAILGNAIGRNTNITFFRHY